MEENQKFELSMRVLSMANIGLWAIEVVEGEEPRMYADATMCRLLGIVEGLPPEQVYHAWYDNISPNHYDAVTEAVNKMADGSVAEVQYPWRHPVKGEMFVRCGGIRNMAFKRGLRFEGCHQDVTEMIHVQKQAAKSELENAFLTKMLAGVPAPVFIKSADDFRYRLCNESFAHIHRRTIESFVGIRDSDLFPDEAFAKQLEDHDRETIASPGIHYFPCHPCGVEGKTRLFDKWESSIDGGEGRKYIVGTLLDITDLKRAERAKSDFFAKVSHDIRTPLNAVIGYSQMLSVGVESAIERKEYLDSILFSAETLLDLINDVLDLSKLEAGKMVIAPERCAFGSLVHKVLRSVAPRATSRSVQLNAKVDGIPELELDMRRIRQILFNLIGNAVKFTDNGTVEISATFDRLNARIGRLTFSVRDSGVGMSKEDLKKVFAPFVQAGSGPQRHGTGLGLSICKQLVEAMHGSIVAKSELGKGSEFTVRIEDVPYHADSAPVAVNESVDSAIDINRSVWDMRLLLVDDIKMNLSVLKSMLKRLGVTRVTTAEDGVEALELLKKDPKAFDAVLTDMWMPRCDGMELVKRIRESEATASLPVYVVTADVECGNGDRTAFNGVLLKPLTLESLREFVRGIGK